MYREEALTRTEERKLRENRKDSGSSDGLRRERESEGL